MRRLAAGLGIGEFPFVDAAAYWRWIDLCEAEGADSLWHSDRLVGDVPVLECLSALAAIAGRTRRIKFGMNVLSVAMRDPVLVAKQCATIDVLSQGRLLPAFGIGSDLSPDWKALGLQTAGRGERTDEALEIMARLWAGEEVNYSGRHFQIAGAKIRPLPVQSDLPLWIGGSSPAAIRRTARFGTGWQGGLHTPEQIAEIVTSISAATRAAGRSIDADHYGVTMMYRFGSRADLESQAGFSRAKARYKFDISNAVAFGDASDILEHLGRYVAAGASKFVMAPVAADGDELFQQTARLLKDVAPRVASLPQ